MIDIQKRKRCNHIYPKNNFFSKSKLKSSLRYPSTKKLEKVEENICGYCKITLKKNITENICDCCGSII